MQLHEIRAPKGANREKKRVGRGSGSGLGKTCGRGMDGQKKRTHPGIRPYFEGGQMPLVRRIPKRGFNNTRFATEFQEVNLMNINIKFQEGDKVTPEIMKEKGLIRYTHKPVKILGKGNLEKTLEISAHAFSKTAKEKIEARGGKAIIIKND
ncbi:MAG: 50S ribosomal protein L15 [Candidatus Omnitrophica bacterium 4484_49]|nr:50S ribosomal protein L15 [Candidatus Omnitrophota bacterium]OQX83967.1 MAG: 50S ribosomal protein L15 [Candidatus Omnitrophica bacterium 4484_49]